MLEPNLGLIIHFNLTLGLGSNLVVVGMFSLCLGARLGLSLSLGVQNLGVQTYDKKNKKKHWN